MLPRRKYVTVKMGELHLENETGLIEAILFMETTPRDTAALSRISGLGVEAVDAVLEKLEEKYAAPDSGLALLKVGEGVLLNPRKEHWEFLKERYGKKSEGRLSRAALETLAIVAYSQPITRAEIEAIRGVSADNMIRLLMEKNLVREAGKKDIPGKPIQYGTTKEFLKFLKLVSIGDLPPPDEVLVERFDLAR
jgi:segregation and condensation protein B